MKQGLPLAPGMQIGYVVKDARNWEVDRERTASEFDVGYYGGAAGESLGRGGVCLGTSCQELTSRKDDRTKTK